jgi:sucrose-6-phosphate hydrolase SacC (GH32 family)
LYYIGWSLRVDVPYHNNLGLAISRDNGNTWEKYSKGPVLSTSHLEPGYIGTVSILIEDNIWRMWYLSCLNWIESDLGMEPTYDIKYAESNDGINWKPQGITCIPLDNDEGGISSQRVLKLNDEYHMWYSVRNKLDYRKNTDNSYKIKKSTSKDGINWIKSNKIELDIDLNSNWDNIMVCYPFIIENNNKLIMFYNGNEFGKTGIGYAINQSIR